MSLNQIKEVLERKGIEDLRPSEEKLEEIDTTLYIWNKWVKKKLDPTITQLYKIADFLNCDVRELLPDIKYPSDETTIR